MIRKQCGQHRVSELIKRIFIHSFINGCGRNQKKKLFFDDNDGNYTKKKQEKTLKKKNGNYRKRKWRKKNYDI